MDKINLWKNILEQTPKGITRVIADKEEDKEIAKQYENLINLCDCRELMGTDHVSYDTIFSCDRCKHQWEIDG